MAINPIFSKPVTPGAGSPAQTTKAAKDLLAGIDWSAETLPAALKPLDTAGTNPERMQQIAKLPKGVRDAFDFYFKHVETEDWGSVSAYKFNVNGQQMFAVRTGTDGDDGYVEVFNFAGKRVASGLQGWADDGKGGFKPTTTWDAKLGAVRAKVTEND